MFKEIKLNFGKYKEKSINEIPDSYLIWCKENIMTFIKKRQPELYYYLLNNFENIGFIERNDVVLEETDAFDISYYGDYLFIKEIL